MQYSFIRPRPKQIISNELKLVLFFFSVTVIMLGVTYMFLSLKTYGFRSDIVQIENEVLEYNATIAKMNGQIAFIEGEAGRAEQVFTSNTVLKESIHNLFDLVPDRITLSKAELTHDGLVLYGVTPNKEIYEFMLQAPLRSIFHRTYSSFYPLENGWYRFVSKNYLDEEAVE